MKQYMFIMLLYHIPLSAVNFINVTDAPIYFSVFYKAGNSIKRQIKELYTAQPNGKYFVSTHTLDLKNPALKIINFPWPKQKCVEFTKEELIGLGVGAATAGALGGMVLGGAGAIALGASEMAAGTTAIGGSALGAGAATGAVQTVVSGEGMCKAEHYPRTVLFSFSKADIEQLKYDRKSFPQLQRNTGLYFGDNVDGGETHFLFYNPYGFDPRYAAYGKTEPQGAIRAGKINSQSYDGKPPIADALRQYLRFVEYYGIVS